MSGMTAFEKILAAHRLEEWPDGSTVVWLDRVFCHEITTPTAILKAQAQGTDRVFNANRIKAMVDHVSPSKDTDSAIQAKILRDWAKGHDIEFFDVGNNGVCHALIPEMGLVWPGQFAVMGDSHTCTHGAFCAITAGIGTTELEGAIKTGIWVIPKQKVIRVNFIGELPSNVFSKDLILALIKMIGTKGATNAVLEFGGPVIKNMSMEARMTITNMAVEAGATTGMMMVDKNTTKYRGTAFKHLVHENVEIGMLGLTGEMWNSDPDAAYDKVIEIDVSDMVPLATQNYSPGDVVPVKDLVGQEVNQVFIGSCTNGRLEDLRIAANVFRLMGSKVAPGVRCIVVPATQHIWDMAMHEGLFEIFRNAGCHISGPSCGACLGMSCGVIAPGEVCASTSNRNFDGRMGKGGMVHLVSPATAATTALNGMLMEPSVAVCDLALRRIAITESDDLVELTVDSGWKPVSSQRPDYQKLLPFLNVGKAQDFSGKAFLLPRADVNTDLIIPAEWLNKTDPAFFGQHCLEAVIVHPETRARFFNSKVLVTLENFGCGSSREHAPWALLAAGIRCVIAPSFARIFESSMFANALLCITLPQDKINQLLEDIPQSISVSWSGGFVQWTGPTGFVKAVEFALTDFQKELIANGGYVNVIIKTAARLQAAGLLK
jgi:3-isopropylmalate/(R)-2-methylmalate dehydratase large subunit